jgi:hypothetical protein
MILPKIIVIIEGVPNFTHAKVFATLRFYAKNLSYWLYQRHILPLLNAFNCAEVISSCYHGTNE